MTLAFEGLPLSFTWSQAKIYYAMASVTMSQTLPMSKGSIYLFFTADSWNEVGIQVCVMIFTPIHNRRTGW